MCARKGNDPLNYGNKKSRHEASQLKFRNYHWIFIIFFCFPLIQAVFDSNGILISAKGAPFALGDNVNDSSYVEDDEEMLGLINVFRGEVEKFRNIVVGESSVFLNAKRENIRTRETNLGNLICESMVGVRAFREILFSMQSLLMLHKIYYWMVYISILISFQKEYNKSKVSSSNHKHKV